MSALINGSRLKTGATGLLVLLLLVEATSYLASGKKPGLALVPISGAHAAEDDNVRRTPAMRQNIHQRFSRIRSLADQDKLDEALKALESVGSGSLNSYERAMRWNLEAFLHHQKDDLAKTAHAYRKVLEQPDLPLSLEQDALYSLARVESAREQYGSAFDALERWFDLKEKPGSQAYALKAQLLYQSQEWDQALAAIDQAIAAKKESGGGVKENWYLLKRGIHYQQDDYEGLKEVLKVLVRDFTKASYLKQLAAVYGELGATREQVAVLEAAYEKGYLEKESEFKRLSQLLASQDNPYKAALVLEKGIDRDIVKTHYKNLKRMGDNYLMAKEYEKALQVFERAAEKSDNGEIYFRMAQVSADLTNWAEAETYARKAVERGDFDQLGRAHVVHGLSLFNQDRFAEALQAFERARKFKETQNIAKQWHEYVNRQRKRHKELRS